MSRVWCFVPIVVAARVPEAALERRAPASFDGNRMSFDLASAKAAKEDSVLSVRWRACQANLAPWIEGWPWDYTDHNGHQAEYTADPLCPLYPLCPSCP
jgi:hypothetical protein